MKVGDQVICIDATGTDGLVHKQIYTIRSLSACCTFNVGLEEVTDRSSQCRFCGESLNDRVFMQDRFRKLETDLITQALELANCSEY